MCKCWAVCGPWILAVENVSILAKSVKPWQILTFFFIQKKVFEEKNKNVAAFSNVIF